MSTPEFSLRNGGDLRLEQSDYIYDGDSEEIQNYKDRLETLELYNANIVPVDELETEPKLQNYLQNQAEDQTREIRNELNRFNINNIEVTDRGLEREILSYDPALLNVPSIRSPGSVREKDLMVRVDHNDPPEGKEIPDNKRSSGNFIPVFLDMIDSNYSKQGIFLGNELIATTLKLNPNPQSLTVNSAKKINRYTTMTRWVEEHWGDDPDTVTLSGSTFSFYGYNTSEGHVGLTSAYRDQTSAYKFLKSLQKFFQVNGLVYQTASDYEGSNALATSEFLSDNPEFVGNHPRKGMVKERLYIRLNFDYLVFIGRFESFDIIEDSENPYRMQYNAIFKSEKTLYKLDKAPDRGAVTSFSEVVPVGGSFENTLAQEGAFV